MTDETERRRVFKMTFRRRDEVISDDPFERMVKLVEALKPRRSRGRPRRSDLPVERYMNAPRGCKKQIAVGADSRAIQRMLKQRRQKSGE